MLMLLCGVTTNLGTILYFLSGIIIIPEYRYHAGTVIIIIIVVLLNTTDNNLHIFYIIKLILYKE